MSSSGVVFACSCRLGLFVLLVMSCCLWAIHSLLRRTLVYCGCPVEPTSVFSWPGCDENRELILAVQCCCCGVVAPSTVRELVVVITVLGLSFPHTLSRRLALATRACEPDLNDTFAGHACRSLRLFMVLNTAFPRELMLDW